ncbi:MAG TPA: hypothetical protein VLX89_12955 [Actinomycetota bacterium]|nr:hypothetical protein [Actinomycetota bacterium]
MLRRPASRAAVLGVALGGVLIGHELTYAVLQPRAASRAALLASTGHAYLGLADHAALAIGIVSLAAFFLSRLGRRDDDPSFVELLGRLAGFQILAFATIEVIERLGVGAPLGDLERILPVGAVVQLIVAAAAALLLRSVLRAADAVASALGSAPPALASASVGLVAWTDVVHSAAAPLRVRGRAPPR